MFDIAMPYDPVKGLRLFDAHGHVVLAKMKPHLFADFCTARGPGLPAGQAIECAQGIVNLLRTCFYA